LSELCQGCGKWGMSPWVAKVVMEQCMFNRDAKYYCSGAPMKVSMALEVVELNVLILEDPSDSPLNIN